MTNTWCAQETLEFVDQSCRRRIPELQTKKMSGSQKKTRFADEEYQNYRQRRGSKITARASLALDTMLTQTEEEQMKEQEFKNEREREKCLEREAANIRCIYLS